MKKFSLLTNVFIFLASIGFAQLKVKNLLCENRVNPVGLDVPFPRFSWQLLSDQKNVMQTAYEIRVGIKSGNKESWNSGKKLSDQSIFVPYTGAALQSAATYFWQVRVWDNKG